MPRADRIELWNETHEVLREFVQLPETTRSLRANIPQLRKMYEDMASGHKSPKFSSSTMRDAYLVAYHPGHASMAHFILDTHQYAGRHLDVHLYEDYVLTVLGAGGGAETLAFLKWINKSPDVSLRQLQINLLDIQDWSLQRQIGLYPLMYRYANQGRCEINEIIADVCDPEGRTTMRNLVAKSDLIICPALLTELSSNDDRNRLLIDISESMKPDARLLVFDQSYVNNFDSFSTNARYLKEVSVLSGGRFLLDLQDKVPTWLSAIVLDGTDGLIPRKKYAWSWLVCNSPMA
jgi:hypothetical protein